MPVGFDRDMRTLGSSLTAKSKVEKEKSEIPPPKYTPVVKQPNMPLKSCLVVKSAPEKEKSEATPFQSTPRNNMSNKPFPNSIPGIKKSKPATQTRPVPPEFIAPPPLRAKVDPTPPDFVLPSTRLPVERPTSHPS